MSLAFRIANRAPYGALLKHPRPATHKAPARTPRVLEPDHLACIRRLPCTACGLEPCGEAAHVRMQSGAYGKRSGMGVKPDDRFAVPLCHPCHMEQHREGELTYWYRLNLSPLLLCTALHNATSDLPRMRKIVIDFMERRR